MATEIERKFLFDGSPDRLRGIDGERIEQGYVAVAGEVEVRLRKVGGRRLLGAKLGHGELRWEVEVSLGSSQFDAFWPLTESRRLRKVRYLVPLGGGLEAEVDVYEGDLAGLVTAEVEFGFERQSRDFQPPAWLGEEITDDRRYANQSLALEGAPAFGPSPKGKPLGVASRAYRLKGKESPAAGVRRIALGRTEKALERLEGVEGDELAAAVHGARKDLKKLRGVLRLVRHQLGKKRFRAENRRFRDAGRLLGSSRDAEVKLETLAHLRHDSAALPADAAERWEGMLESERDELEAAERKDDGRLVEASKAIEKGRCKIHKWQLRSDSWELVGPGLSRSYGEGRRALKAVLAEPSSANLHEWRKRAKDLWYQLRILHDAWPQQLGATVGATHELTELLGDHHDLALLADDLRGRDGLGDRGPFETAIARRQEELLEGALAIGRRLYAEKPKAFGRRIERYWDAWREA